MLKQVRHGGFTIVELLIFIVVIAILAAITIVAYNGIQQRAQISKISSDLSAINKAIQMYYADNSSYPSTSNTWSGQTTYGGNGANFVPGLAPAYLASMPLATHINSSSDYLYRSNGTDYKLMAHDGGGATGTGYAKLCPIATSANLSMADTARNCWGWGYWSTGGSSF